ncbi:hypothetical protein K3495_g17005, partial [Podosphaera aphanis]
PFGRNCYVHIHEDSRPPGSKLLPRALEGKFVGYTNSTKIFRIWIPSKNKIIESPSVKFAPHDSGEVTINLDSRGNSPQAENDEAVFPCQKPQPTTVEPPHSLDDPSQQLLKETQAEHHESPTSPLHPTPEPCEIPGAFLESPQTQGRPKRPSKPIQRYGSQIWHGPTIRTREEHNSERNRLLLAEEIKEEVGQNAVALA